MDQELTRGKPIEIQLETTINQGGKTHHHLFEEEGRMIELNGHYYLRYEESREDTETPPSVTFKIHPQGRVTVIRNAEQTTRLTFDRNQKTISRYVTPAGQLELNISTTSMELALKDRPFSGYLEVNYQMVTGSQLLGDYQLRLRFTT